MYLRRASSVPGHYGVLKHVMSINPLQSLEPTDNLLLALIFERVDDSMLLEIAKADYGDDVDIHLAALHQIRVKNIPRPDAMASWRGALN